MMSEEDQMRLELQRMQRQADEITDQSLESTRRMLQMTEETQDTGIQTLVALDEQGEKLNRIEANLDEINDGMKEAEKNLTGLEKFCGLCVCRCRKRPDFETTEKYKKGFSRTNDGPSSSNGGPSGSGGNSENNAPKSGYIKRINEDDAREDEMDENLGQVAGIVGNLKTMALDMGVELERQNVQIDSLGNKAMANESRIEQANKRAEQILRK